MPDIKLASAAWGFRKMDLPEYFEAVKALGIDYVEVNLGPNSPGHLQFDARDEDLATAMRQAEDAGVEIVALAGGNNFAADDLDAEIAKVESQIEMCEALGAEVLRIFAGWITASNYTDATFERISGALGEVAACGVERDVKIAVENHGGVTATGAQCYRLLLEPICDLAATQSAGGLGLNYDPANFRYAGEDPLAALMVTSELVNYSHWKDVSYDGDQPRYCAVGEGIIDWEPVVAALLASGFDGYCAIEYEETEDVVRGTRDSAQYLRELVASLQ